MDYNTQVKVFLESFGWSDDKREIKVRVKADDSIQIEIFRPNGTCEYCDKTGAWYIKDDPIIGLCMNCLREWADIL